MEWKCLPQIGDGPGPRSSHTLLALKDSLYVFGGELEPRVPVDNVLYKFDTLQGRWEKVVPEGGAPSARNAPAAAVVGSSLYYFGGRSGKDMGEGSSNDLWQYNTATNKWTELLPQQGQAPCKRSYHRMVSVGKHLYVFGGCGEAGRLCDLHSYDTETGTWEQLPSSERITGRGGAELVAGVPGTILVIGGFSGQENNDTHSFNLETRKWDCPACCDVPSALTARSVFAAGVHSAHSTAAAGSSTDACCGSGSSSSTGGHHSHEHAHAAHEHGANGATGATSCPHGGHIVCFGGEVDPSDKGHAGAGCFTASMMCFDTAKKQWHKVEQVKGDAPSPRGWFAAASCSSGLYVHGGLSGDNSRLSDLHLLQM